MDAGHDHCDHSKLAVTTLLLALHLQRNNASPKKTRSVFLTFFRIVTSDEHTDDECARSAKVLQAFALLKQGNALKSLELAKAAIKLDPTFQSELIGNNSVMLLNDVLYVVVLFVLNNKNKQYK